MVASRVERAYFLQAAAAARLPDLLWGGPPAYLSYKVRSTRPCTKPPG